MDLIIFGRYFWSDMELALWKQPQGSPMIGSCDVVALAPPEPHRGCPAGSPVGQRIHLHRTRQNVTRALKNKSGKPPRKNLEKTKLYQHRPQIASAISAVPIQNMQISIFVNIDIQRQDANMNTNTISKTEIRIWMRNFMGVEAEGANMLIVDGKHSFTNLGAGPQNELKSGSPPIHTSDDTSDNTLPTAS